MNHDKIDTLALYFINTGEFYRAQESLRENFINAKAIYHLDDLFPAYRNMLASQCLLWTTHKDYRKSFPVDERNFSKLEADHVAAEIWDHWTDMKYHKQWFAGLGNRLNREGIHKAV